MPISPKRLLLPGALAAIVLLAALLLWKRPNLLRGSSARSRDTSIAATGGRSMPRFDLGAAPIHRQRDDRWKDQTIGGSGESVGAVGCVVCSVSMALARFGIAIPPDSLNALFKAHGGYTDQGWLKWETVSEVTGGKAEIEVPKRLEHAAIDDALGAGWPVLAKVLIRGKIGHWVLVVGKDGAEYLIKDPLGDGTKLDSLSAYRSPIYAIRVVRPVGS